MHGPPADWTWPHGAPRPTTFPTRSAKPHELLRAQLTHPEPPDVDDDVPSFPARSTPLRRGRWWCGRTPALSATVAAASDGAPCCQLAPCIVARHRR